MQCFPDMICTECSQEFESAGALLQHFATHVCIPKTESETSIELNNQTEHENDKSSDSGIEDVNPLKLCLVTIEDNQFSNVEIQNGDHSQNKVKVKEKKFQCSVCLRKFGWSSDLKRHILTHTGERPFQCNFCNSSFTRNFLLRNHQNL